jgi:predicted short-subunit dehydrogenase-like oxidoreductase (DUF2520 family)
MKSKITLIGSGNVATNLAHAFDKVGHTIHQVISLNIEHAKILASKFGAYYGDTTSEFYLDSDYILICVNDDAIAQALKLIPDKARAVICHTSGSSDMNSLSERLGEYGVLYPLQSLRKEEIKELLEIPMMVEGNTSLAKQKISELADTISNKVIETSSEQRLKYHLAAVFANNFTNLMYTIADDYLSKEGLDFDHLLPLVQETAQRLKKAKAQNWQTGPAKRGDNNVIAKHIAMLGDSDTAEIYKQLTEFIRSNQV